MATKKASTSRKRWLIVGLLLLVALAAAGWMWRSGDPPPQYRSTPLARGNISATVSATGTLAPTTLVKVGSQVSGLVAEVLVDFNSPVKRGQLLARIDPESLQFKLRQSQADLESARTQVLLQQANLAASDAGVSRAQANRDEAGNDHRRKTELVGRGFISRAELDTASVKLRTADADVRAAQAQRAVVLAQMRNVEANVAQREAAVQSAQIDLDRTSIKAPVDGVVIKRSVAPGQTVAASFQTPEMFEIAEDLRDMQVEASIDESEVGQVHAGQSATFTVDAYPGRTFEGKVTQVRKAAESVSNVVTYKAIVTAANPDLLLVPGMTANVRIATASREDVLLVPNAALRFRPSDLTETLPPLRSGRGRLWVEGENGKPAMRDVRTGLTNGIVTEVSGEALEAGVPVIVGTQGTGAAAGARPGGMAPGMGGPPGGARAPRPR